MNRKQKYVRQIQGWRWEDIRSEAGREGYAYLGNVFNLTPSGKYYQPFACSNVVGCKRCGGTGSVNNSKADPAKYDALDAVCTVFLQHLWKTEGGAYGWSAESKAHMAAVREARDLHSPRLTCTWCNGSGSHEAAKDADWHEALETVSKQFGLFVGGPDGADGCDVWVGDADALERMEENEAV